MRLIGCYINGFGKFTDRSFDFENGCNIFCHENGFGKSTLAAFIRVMLYGFSGESKRSELENERKRFKPWQGGIYGGNLTFETNGKRYVVTRAFGDKDKDDVFELRNADTNVVSTDFSLKLGEELFQIDADSFKRTIFISQNDCTTETNGSINAKLGNIAENTDDINNFENADERLKDLINAMSPRRKTGSLNKLKNEIAELEIRIKKGDDIDSAIASDLEHIEAIKKEQETLRQRQQELKELQHRISIYNDLKAKKKEYIRLREEYKEREAAVTEKKGFFKGIIPAEEELAACINHTTRLEALKEAVENYRLTEEEEGRFEECRRVLGGNRPSKQNIEENRKKLSEINQLRIRVATEKLTQDDENKLKSLEGTFSQGAPSKEDIDEKLAAWGRREDIKSRLIGKETNYGIKKSELEQNGRKNQNEKVLLIIGIIAMVAGIVSAFASLALGITVLALGISMTIFSCILGKKYNVEREVWHKQENEIEQLKQEIDEDNEKIQNIERDIQSFCALYGAEYRKELINNILFNLQQDSSEYIRLKNKKELFESSGMLLQLTDTENSLKNFLAGYELYSQRENEDYSAMLLELERICETEKQLSEKKTAFTNAENNYREQLSEIIGYIETLSFETKENLQEQLLEIKRHKQALDMALEEFGRAKKEKEQFEAANPDFEKFENSENHEDENMTLENIAEETGSITDRLTELQSMLTAYIRRMEQNQEERNAVFEAEATLEEFREKYALDELKFKRLERVRELLSSAKEDFTAKYTEPVLRGFKKYYKLLAGSEASMHFLDANMKLTVAEQGLQRDTAFFSTGLRDLLGICMRMALVEAMYKDEKPFIIFDDPFTNLDSDKTERGIEFVNEISKDYQVIYFTCHRSRGDGE